jgi:O-acetylserine/cysteine efflux transporter
MMGEGGWWARPGSNHTWATTRQTLPPLHAVLALVVASVWGSNFVIMKFAPGHLPPLTLSALRFTFAVVPWVFFCKRPAGWGWLLARHPAATISPLSLLVPAFGMGASAIFLHEPLSPWKLKFFGEVATFLKRQPLGPGQIGNETMQPMAGEHHAS